METRPKIVIDPFIMMYKGEVKPQTGDFYVTANSLDNDGNPSGGGLVATFDNWENAEACLDKLMEWNPAYDPEIWYSGGDNQFKVMGSDKSLEILRDRIEEMTEEAREKVAVLLDSDDEKPTEEPENDDEPRKGIQNYYVF
ncbi:hypothetical protein ACFL3T_00665 [Patescibacteria group bacterium]